MNDSIIIKKDEFQDLVAKEVAKALVSRSRIAYSNLIFNNVRFTADDLRELNAKYSVPAKANLNTYAGTTYSRHQHVTKEFNDREVVTDVGPYSDAINTEIRHLTLAVLGESRIKSLTESDYNDAVSIYAEFKELFLRMYEKRLDDLFGGNSYGD